MASLRRILQRVLGRRRRPTAATAAADLLRDAAPTGDAAPILFWVPGGMPLMLHVEGALALALRLRGVPVHLIICDGPFEACVRREFPEGVLREDWASLCGGCRAETSAFLDALGLPYSFIGDYVPAEERAALRARAATADWSNLDAFNDELPGLGDNIRSGFLRYLKGYPREPEVSLIPDYAYTGLLVAEAARRAYDRHEPRRVFMSHGIYVDWGPALHVAVERGLDATCWMASYWKYCFYLRHVREHGHIDFHNLSPAAWEECRSTPVTEEEAQRLQRFTHDRYAERLSFDMKHLNAFVGDREALRARYGLVADKPIWGIITHINWDCVSDYAPMAYPTFDDWILDTLDQVSAVKDVQWLVKIHPAETFDNPQSGVQSIIDAHFPTLPPHVKVIAATDELSPLDFFQLIDGGVSVYGTAGLELALQSKPMILAGKAHYGGKGFTYDAPEIAAYRARLREAAALGPLDAEQQRLAEQYATNYFLRRQIPLPVVHQPGSAWWGLQFDALRQLLPGRDPYVDFLCERLIDGGEFIMDAALAEEAEAWVGRVSRETNG